MKKNGPAFVSLLLLFIIMLSIVKDSNFPSILGQFCYITNQEFPCTDNLSSSHRISMVVFCSFSFLIPRFQEHAY